MPAGFLSASHRAKKSPGHRDWWAARRRGFQIRNSTPAAVPKIAVFFGCYLRSEADDGHAYNTTLLQHGLHVF